MTTIASTSFLSRLARSQARFFGRAMLTGVLGLSACGGPIDGAADPATVAEADARGTTEVASDAATSAFTANLTRALGIARRHVGAFATYADGSHDGDDILFGRIPAPRDTSVLTAELLALVQGASSYSEAMLLVRVAGQDLGRPAPSVPAELSSNPSDPDFEYAGKNVQLPYAVQTALAAMKAARDARLDAMSEAELERHEIGERAAHLVRRRAVAAALGWRFDGRPDLYVASVDSDDIWRKKRPSDHVPSRVTSEPSSSPLESDPGELVVDFAGPAGAKRAILGSDQRQMRSAYNGHDMGSNNWKAKGALVDIGSTTDEVPVRVDCTGTKISQRLVVTAGHCLANDSAWNGNRKWIPGADGVSAAVDGTDPSPNGFKNSQTRHVRGDWFDHEWVNYDFGLFVLHDNASSCQLPWHGWRNRSGLTNDTVHLYGYPGANRDCAASPLADDKCGGSMFGMQGTITYAGSYRLRYDIDTQPGQSGSAIYEIDDGDRFVLGVHHGEYSGSRNQGVRINDGNSDMIGDVKSDNPAHCD